jgi:murein DD-endopeptidase MepM/ murein hydrolase activator NlpD
VFSETYQDYRHHSGIDFKVPAGANVRAALTGIVLSVDSGGTAGTAIVVDHQDGRQTIYSGLKQVKVDVGDMVKQGQVIGQVGDPGESEIADGPHLHFELSRDGEPVDPVSLFKR